MKIQMGAAFALASILLAGCAQTPPLKPWPDSLGTGDGAVLLGADIHVTIDPGVSRDFLGFALLFNRPDATSSDRPVAWAILSDKNSTTPRDNLFLFPLPAGEYGLTNLEAPGPAGVPFVLLNGGSFRRFTVRPGQVTVLGTIVTSAHLVSVNPSQGRFERSVSTKVDTDTKKALVAAALGRVQPTASLWIKALKAAQEDLQ
jgi:hypothetical protein